ncbi:capsular polysaccharide export protein, LipB/KpsS family [Roseivirga echinicomitans]
MSKKGILFVGYEGDWSLRISPKLDGINVEAVGFVIKNVAQSRAAKELNCPFFERKISKEFLFSYQPQGDLGKELLSGIHFNNDMFYYVLNRHFRTTLSLTFTLIKQKLIAYCKDIIAKTKPDLVVFNVTPHDPVAYAIYALCLAENIDTLIYLRSWTFSGIQVYRRIGEPNELLLNTPGQLDSELKQIVDERLAEFIKEAPSFVKKFKTSHGSVYKRLTKAFLDKNKPSIKRVQAQLSNEKDRVYYNGLCKIRNEGDLIKIEKRIIYFALHFQPEQTTMPSGDIFAQQWLVIEWLQREMGDDYVILVKEHPSQFLLPHKPPSRSKELYDALDSIPMNRVLLVSGELESRRIIKQASIIATITGTVGYEGVLQKKPVLVFGDSPTIGIHGVTKINSIADLKAFFTSASAKQELDYKLVHQSVYNILSSKYFIFYNTELSKVTREKDIDTKLMMLRRYMDSKINNSI